MNLKYIIIAIFIFSLLPIQTAFGASAAFCNNLRGDPVPAGQQLSGGNATNHTYTGDNCDNIRDAAGNPVGAGQFGRPADYKCIGACIYRVNYCTPLGCEAVYPQRECSTAPAACNNPNTAPQTDVGKAFGQIVPPSAIQKLGFGAAGISAFLSNLVVLIYSISVIIVLFMFFWASFDWITSGGEKEKLASAQKRIVNAVVGLVLLASSFAILKVLSIFTGFSFFK